MRTRPAFVAEPGDFCQPAAMTPMQARSVEPGSPALDGSLQGQEVTDDMLEQDQREQRPAGGQTRFEARQQLARSKVALSLRERSVGC